MINLVLLTISISIGLAMCKPIESDYSGFDYEVPSISSTNEKDITEWNIADDDKVITKRDQSIPEDSSSVNSTAKGPFVLGDIITKVEGSIVQSAFDILTLFKIHNKSSPTDSSEDLEHENKSMLLLTKISTKTEPESVDHPADVSIDKVTVYNANSCYFPLLTAFSLHHVQNQMNKTKDFDLSETLMQKRSANNSIATINVQTTPFPTLMASSSAPGKLFKPDDLMSDEISSKITEGITTEFLLTDSSLATISSMKSTHSSTNSATSLISPNLEETSTIKVTTTAKNLVQDLKNDEEKLKAKVAEIQADPIILSSRV